MEKKLLPRAVGIITIMIIIVLIYLFLKKTTFDNDAHKKDTMPSFPKVEPDLSQENVQETLPTSYNNLINTAENNNNVTAHEPGAPTPIIKTVISSSQFNNKDKLNMKGKKISPKVTALTIKERNKSLAQISWVIQMGSFKNKSNAIILVNKLRQKGYHAFIYYNAKDTLTRVYVGPIFKYASALKLSDQIKKNFNFPMIIKTHQTLSL